MLGGGDDVLDEESMLRRRFGGPIATTTGDHVKNASLLQRVESAFKRVEKCQNPRRVVLG
jgi:hypothetical protein